MVKFFIPLWIGSVIPASPKVLRVVQFVSWMSSAFLLNTSQNSFPHLVFLSIYAFAFLSTLYTLFDDSNGLTIIQIHLALLALYLICYSNSLFYVGSGLILSSVLSWLEGSKEKVRVFQAQILADLCLIFSLFIFSRNDATPDWQAFAGILFLLGGIAKAIPLPGTSSLVHIFLHKGLAGAVLVLLMRMEPYYLANNFFSIVLLSLGCLGLILFTLRSLISKEIQQFVNSFNLGTTTLVVFLYCLYQTKAAQSTFLMCFFLQCGLSLTAQNIVKVMSGERIFAKMGGIRSHALSTFVLSVLTFAMFLIILLSALSLYDPLGVCTFFFIGHCVSAMRFIFLVFLGKNRSSEQVFAHVKDVNWGLILSVFACLVCAGVAIYHSNIHTKGEHTALLFGICALLIVTMQKYRHFFTKLMISSPKFLKMEMKMPFLKQYAKNQPHISNIVSTYSSPILSSMDITRRKLQLLFFEKLYSDDVEKMVPFLLTIIAVLLGIATFWGHKTVCIS
jgi:hypothetical protein